MRLYSWATQHGRDSDRSSFWSAPGCRSDRPPGNTHTLKITRDPTLKLFYSRDKSKCYIFNQFYNVVIWVTDSSRNLVEAWVVKSWVEIHTLDVFHSVVTERRRVFICWDTFNFIKFENRGSQRLNNLLPECRSSILDTSPTDNLKSPVYKTFPWEPSNRNLQHRQTTFQDFYAWNHERYTRMRPSHCRCDDVAWNGDVLKKSWTHITEPGQWPAGSNVTTRSSFCHASSRKTVFR